MRLAVAAALLVAACRAAPLPPPPVPNYVEPPGTGWAQGVDLSIDAGGVADQIRQSGIDFVARYYRDPDSALPPLTPAEAQALSAQGLKIVAVWEWHSPDPERMSYAAGFSDAQMAATEARAVGQPPGSAIYFAVDFNASGDQFDAVAQYFHGIAAALAASGYRIGVYGSGTVCDFVKRSGLAQYSWLGNALNWDGATTYDGWDIQQGQRILQLPFDQDEDEARGDYGAFRLVPG
jgi:Domain of unknown function (DUF1906)